MKTPPAPPYLMPPHSGVVAHPWFGGDGSPLPERLEHWDPWTDTHLFRSVDVDVDAVRSACQLNEDATFALVAAWSSSRSRLGASGDSVELGRGTGALRAELELRVPGDLAGGRLDVQTLLVLRNPGTGFSAISPKRDGAILWLDEARIFLEGSSARFPVAALDFKSIPRLPDGGAWALEWSSEDLDVPVLSGLRLIVNADDEPLLSALRSGSADPRSPTIRSFVMYDVAKTLVHGALNAESFLEAPEAFAEDSLGRLLFELLSMGWPGIPVKALATRLREDPSRLDAELQSYLGVLQ